MPASQEKQTATHIAWAPSIGTDNLCGFASLVPLVDDIIDRPHLYYAASAPDNEFIAQYKLALEITHNEYPQRPTAAKAAAIKHAFAACALADKTARNPFYKVFDLVSIGMLAASDAPDSLNDSLVRRFINIFKQGLETLYASFVASIEGQNNLLQVSAPERAYLNHQDSRNHELFLQHIATTQETLCAEFHGFFNNEAVDDAKHVTNEEITHLFKLACTTYLDAQHQDEPELNDTILKDFMAQNPTSMQTLQAAFATYVQNVNLDVNSEDSTLYAKELLKDARYKNTTDFAHFVLGTAPTFMQDFIGFACDALTKKENAYPARDTDLAYVLTLLGCIKQVTFFKGNNYSSYALNASGRYDFKFNNTGFHWEAEPLAHFVPKIAEDYRLGTSQDNAYLDFVESSKNTLLFFFTEEFMQQATIKALCQNRDAELYRMAQAGQTFIDSTLQVNSLLDNPAVTEGEIDNTLCRLTPDINALLDDPTATPEQIAAACDRLGL